MYVQQKAIRRLLFILRALANNLAGAFFYCRQKTRANSWAKIMAVGKIEVQRQRQRLFVQNLEKVILFDNQQINNFPTVAEPYFYFNSREGRFSCPRRPRLPIFL